MTTWGWIRPPRNLEALRSVIMGMERRFDEDQVAEILRRAADLQYEAGSVRERGTTLAELKRVGEEVGFDPVSIERAVEELERRATDLRVEITSTSTQFEQTAPVELDDEAWEDIVAELRRIGGRSGKTATRGLTREWIGGSDAASITVSARRRGDGTRLRLLLDLGSLRVFTGAIALPFGFLAAVMTAALVSKAGFEPALALLAGLGVGSTILLSLRLAVARWMRSTRRRVSESFQRIVERASVQSDSVPDIRPLVKGSDSIQQNQANPL